LAQQAQFPDVLDPPQVGGEDLDLAVNRRREPAT
jgi:hypothetical protein